MSRCRSDLPASATRWWCVRAPLPPTAAASPWRWSLRSRRLSCADSEGWTASVYSWRPTRGWKVWCLQEDHQTRAERIKSSLMTSSGRHNATERCWSKTRQSDGSMQPTNTLRTRTISTKDWTESLSEDRDLISEFSPVKQNEFIWSVSVIYSWVTKSN